MSQQTKNILLGRFTSMESDTPEGSAVELIESEVDSEGAQLDGTSIAEGSLVDAAADEAVINEAQGDTDELLESAESLESFLYAAQLANKEGAGWTRPEATAYAIGIENVLRPLGLKLSTVGIPSMESFGGARERISSTISVENAITDTLKKIWETIKAQINKLVTYIRDWYLKVVEGTSRLKKRAEAIKEKAGSKSGSPKEAKIKLSLVQGLHVNKQVPTGEQLIKAIQQTNTIVGHLTSDQQAKGYKDALDKTQEAVDHLLEKGRTDDAELATLMKAAASADGGADQVHEVFSHKLDEAKIKQIYPASQDLGMEGATSGEMPGGKRFYSTSPSESGITVENMGSALKNFRIEIRDAADKKVEVESTKEFKTLTPGEVVSISEAVIALCDTIIDYKAQYANYESATKSFLSKMDGVSKKTASVEEGTKEATAQARSFANGIATFIRNGGAATTRFIGYGANLARNSLAYANSSLGQYES